MEIERADFRVEHTGRYEHPAPTEHVVYVRFRLKGDDRTYQIVVEQGVDVVDAIERYVGARSDV